MTALRRTLPPLSQAALFLLSQLASAELAFAEIAMGKERVTLHPSARSPEEEVTPPSRSSETGTAQEQQEEAARRFSEALEHVRAERYQEALNAFQRAQDLSPHPRVLFNIARTHERLFQLGEAISAYQQYLEETGDEISVERRLLIEERIATLTEAQTKPSQTATTAPPEMHLRELTVDCGYPGFEVRADRKTYATTPYRGTISVPTTTRTISFQRSGYEMETHLLKEEHTSVISCHPQLNESPREGETGKLVLSVIPRDAEVKINGQALAPASGLHLPLGEHLVDVSKEGYVSRTSLVHVAPGSSLFDEIHLRPVGSAFPPESEPRTAWTKSKVLGLTLAGLGVGLAGTTVGVFAWNDRRHDRWETQRAELENAPLDEPGLSDDRAASNAQLQKIQRTDTTTWILGASATALFAAGAFAYFFEFPESPTTVGIGPSSFHLETSW